MVVRPLNRNRHSISLCMASQRGDYISMFENEPRDNEIDADFIKRHKDRR